MKYRRWKENRKGFTLVEAVVVLAILAILMAIVSVSVIQWNRWAKFKKQNEYAQTIYQDMQNCLVRYSEAGQLPLLQQQLSNTRGQYLHTLDVTGLKDAEGKEYSLDKIFANSTGYANEGRYQNQICYVLFTAEDYQAYTQNNNHLNNSYKNAATGMTAAELNAVYDMLLPYLYDPSIMNASVAIEFTPDDGQAFSVLYSEADERFEYDPDNKNTSGAVDISDRQEKYRKDRMIGYYGADTLSKATSQNLQKPVLSDVLLRNEEMLSLSFRLSKVSMAIDQLSYEIKIMDAASKDVRAVIYLPGSKVQNAAASADNPVDCKVIYYGKGENDKLEDTLKFYVWKEGKKADQSDVNIHMVLDAADLSASAGVVRAAFETVQQEMKEAAESSVLDFNSSYKKCVNLSDSFSYLRLASCYQASLIYDAMKNGSISSPDYTQLLLQDMIDSRIYCTVQGSGDLYKTTAPKNSNTEHAYFAGASGTAAAGAENPVVSISNARHLYNIRYIEDMLLYDDAKAGTGEGINTADMSAAASAYGVRYELTDNILWSSQKAVTAADPQVIANHAADGRTGMAEEGYLFNAQKVYMQDNYFPSIGQLSSKSEFTSKGGKNYTITGLHLAQSVNSSYGLYGYETEDDVSKAVPYGPVGLFCYNEGDINHVTLDQISSEGTEGVGTFCGYNRGRLNYLTVENSADAQARSEVTGVMNVGGIFGKQDRNDQSIALTYLVNRAAVTNREAAADEQAYKLWLDSENHTTLHSWYLGGITGQLTLPIDAAEDITIELSNCENYGRIRTLSEKKEGQEAQEAQEGRYIGGIIGCAVNEAWTDVTQKADAAVQKKVLERFRISQCTSSPQYTEEEMKELLAGTSEEEIKKENLQGYYVGGIAGYNKHALIADCDTKKEKNKEGYVLGNQYVGGIVGFNEGYGNGGIEGTSKDVYGYNAANVIGMSYVGGIAGCNSIEAEKDANGIIVISNTKTDEIMISNWINTGTVLAVDQYVGGITGYNVGVIENCKSETSDRLAAITSAQTMLGDYAGGIAGYNNGTIQGSPIKDDKGNITGYKKMDIVCNIGGRNFVGGIVGYNDVDAKANDYHLVGGYIQASGSFAGGYAGFNGSKDLLLSTDLKANPNQVTGADCVGGVIGGNIIGVSESPDHSDTLSLSITTDNFLGTIKGRTAVGGFIGYNRIINSAGTSDDQRNKQREITKAMAYQLLTEVSEQSGFSDAFAGYTKLNDSVIYDHSAAQTAGSTGAGQTDVVSKEIFVYADNLSGVTLKITGEKSGSNTMTHLGSITGDLYVGGVLGYNDADTKLYIQNVENRTPVRALQTIVNANEQAGRSNPLTKGDFSYSYVGGILGKVTKYVTLDNCSNVDQGLVKSGEGATYTGALCEINEGTIIHCKASSIGDVNTNFVGGIVGVSKAGARMIDCEMQGNVTVTAKSIAGGAAAENFGLIQNFMIGENDKKPAYVTASDSYAGGIAGINYESADIYYKSEQTAADINLYVHVTARGSEVGGLVGDNSGTLSTVKTHNTEGTAQYSGVIINGIVSGDQNVGGAIGSNRIAENLKEVSYIFNKAAVTAESGNAGGIIGNAAGGMISQCGNAGVITALQGNAGGIVSENAGTIRQCGNYAEVSSKNGNCGGITGINTRNIEYSAVNTSVPEAVDEQKNIILFYWQAETADILKTDKTLVFEGLEYAGGITARNAGAIDNSYVKNLTVQNNAKSNISYLGAAVGENTGTITLPSGTSITNCKVYTYTSGSYIGGAAGINICKAEKSENAGNAGNSKKPETAKKLVSGQISGNISLDKTNPKNMTESISGLTLALKGAASYAYMGGAAGASIAESSASTAANDGPLIEKIYVQASITGKNGTASSGYGGIAGVNQGTIRTCAFDGTITADGTTDNIAILGGIAGVNTAEGIVQESVIAIKTETVIKTNNKGHGYLGGIVGQNGGDVLSCNNAVYSKAKVTIDDYGGFCGGIIGFQQEYADVNGAEGNPVSTGNSWFVMMRSYPNDAGIGGIIGYSNSGEDMQYLENHAEVSASYGELPVGGLIGRMENRRHPGTVVSNYSNYGKISGNKNISGGVGRMKYYALSFTNCTNYGDITAAANDGRASGFENYYTAMGTAAFTSCTNYGRLEGKGYAAGLCTHGEGSSMSVTAIDCVNEGVIAGLNKSAGLVIAENFTKVELYNCRNYGNYTTITNVETDYNRFGGIVYIEIAPQNVTMANCFSMSNAETMTAGKEPTVQNNNFVVKKNKPDESGSDTEETEVYYTKVELSKTNGTSEFMTKANNTDTRWSFSNNTVINGVNKADLTVYFDKAVPLKSFGIWWAGNGSSSYRGYTYTVSLKDEYGFSHYIKEDGSAARESDNAKVYQNVGYNTKNEMGSGYQSFDLSSNTTKFSSITFHVTRIGSDNNNPNNAISSNTFSNYVCTWGFNASLRGMVDANSTMMTMRSSSGGTGSAGSSYGIPAYIYSQAAAEGVSNAGYCIKTEDGKFLIKDLIFADPKITPKSLFDSFAPYLQTDETDKKAARQQVYEAVDPKIPKAYEALINGADVSVPKDLKITTESGRLKLTWNTDGYNYTGMNVWYKVVASDGTTVLVDNTRSPETLQFGIRVYYVPIDQENWQKAKVTFWLQSENGDRKSAEVSVTDTVKVSEAVPLVHFELVSNTAYRAVLENPEDYIGDKATTIKVSGPASTEIKTASGYFSPEFSNTSLNYNTNAASYAAGNTWYAESVKRNIQTWFYGTDILQTQIYRSTFNGFMGTTISGLSQKITMIGKNELYVNSDVVMKGYPVKIGDQTYYLDLTVSQGTNHIAASASEVTVVSQLSGLPDDLLTYQTQNNAKRAIEVRTYAWQGQAFISWFGHPVAENIQSSELLTLKDTNMPWNGTGENAPSVFDAEHGCLNPGYILSCNKDGTYNVLYSAIAANENTYKDKILYSRVYTQSEDGNGFEYDGGKLNIQNSPVISTELQRDLAKGSYTFTWDAGMSESDAKNAVYDLKLYGVTKDAADHETIKLLASPTVDSSGAYTNGTGWRYTFTDASGSWRYAEIKLVVERRGTEDANGITTALPAQSEQSYDVRIQLSQITKPVISLVSEGGVVQKDNLKYQIQWSTVPEKERNAVECYRITITDTQGSSAESMVLEVRENLADTSITKIVDLGGFAGGHRLNISVQAIASEMIQDPEDSAVQILNPYCDGPSGVVSEITLPERLPVPLMDKAGEGLTSSPLFDENRSETLESLRKGITLTMRDSGNTEIQGKYQLAAAVFEDIPNAVQPDDKSAVTPADWDKDALEGGVLISREKPVSMNGDFRTSEYTLPDLDKYAGRWIKVLMRSVSESRISSQWTDEDAAGETLNYQWIHIPKMQVSTPVLKAAAAAAVSNKDNNNNDIDVTQTQVTFQEQEYADSYSLQLIYNQISDSRHGSSYPVSWIYVEKNSEGKMDVFVQSTMQTPVPAEGAADKSCRQNADAVYAGTLAEDGTLLSLNLLQTAVSGSQSMSVDSHISYTKAEGSKHGQFNFVLPEVETVKNSSTEFHFANSLYVQACVSEEENQKYYGSSQLSVWKSETRADGTVTSTIGTQEACKEAPAKEDVTVTDITKLEWSADVPAVLTITGTSKEYVVFHYTVLDQDKKQVASGYAAPYVKAADSSDTAAPVTNIVTWQLYSDSWKDYADGTHTLTLDAAYVYGRTQEGVSAWQTVIPNPAAGTGTGSGGDTGAGTEPAATPMTIPKYTPPETTGEGTSGAGIFAVLMNRIRMFVR